MINNNPISSSEDENLNSNVDNSLREKQSQVNKRVDSRGQTINGPRLNSNRLSTPKPLLPQLNPRKAINDQAKKWLIGAMGGSAALTGGFVGWVLFS